LRHQGLGEKKEKGSQEAGAGGDKSNKVNATVWKKEEGRVTTTFRARDAELQGKGKNSWEGIQKRKNQQKKER